MQANRNIHLFWKKAPIYKLSRSKSPKPQQIRHSRHTRKISGLFLLCNTGVDFSSRNNLANLGSFAKVSVPVQFIIPLFACTARPLAQVTISVINNNYNYNSNNKMYFGII